MAVTAQKSTQVSNREAGTLNDSRDVCGRIERYYFKAVQSGAGDQGSTLDLVHLPPGRHRVYLEASKFKNPAIVNGQCVRDVQAVEAWDPAFRETMAALLAVEVCEAVTQSASPFEVATPWSIGDLTDASGHFRLRQAQSGDTQYLTHRNHPPQKLARFSALDWTCRDFLPDDGPWGPRTPPTPRSTPRATPAR